MKDISRQIYAIRYKKICAPIDKFLKIQNPDNNWQNRGWQDDIIRKLYGELELNIKLSLSDIFKA
jgi:hypothetical protein